MHIGMPFAHAIAGVFAFFVIFALSMILLQFFIAAVQLWMAGHVPKIFLVRLLTRCTHSAASFALCLR